MKELLGEIPKHLEAYIVDQEYDQYTAIDHACWRYIMKLSKAYFSKNAHPMYLDGLEETGISSDRIPKIFEMDAKLSRFGWRAVSITGFIPPAIFSEMLALKLLPIACDMRKLENIEYTPSPDIVHEAAGHAPIIADKDYGEFLEKMGTIAKKVIFAKEDCDVYEAILKLSELKEDPSCTPEEVKLAEEELERTQKSVTYISEATEHARLSWWTTEYGLIKDGDKFLIYGAGLLSSIGESYECLSDKVKKLPFTLDCLKQGYDITKAQPQLFYSNSFKEMENVIDAFAASMAYQKGGTESLDKALKARTVTSTVLETGLQIGGILKEYRVDEATQKPYFIAFDGPTQMAYKDTQIENQGPKYHFHGFSSPLGKIKGLDKDASQLSSADLERVGCVVGKRAKFEFESGVSLDAEYVGLVAEDGKNLLLQFKDCSVKKGNEILFDPSWGPFDMACGSGEVVSVFGGAADRASYISDLSPEHVKPRKQIRNLTSDNQDLANLYQLLRDLRKANSFSELELEKIYTELKTKFSEDWLLRMELLEYLKERNYKPDLQKQICSELNGIKSRSKTISKLIERGMELV